MRHPDNNTVDVEFNVTLMSGSNPEFLFEFTPSGTNDTEITLLSHTCDGSMDNFEEGFKQGLHTYGEYNVTFVAVNAVCILYQRSIPLYRRQTRVGYNLFQKKFKMGSFIFS